MKIVPMVVLCAAGLAPLAAAADSPYNYVAAYLNHSRQSGFAQDDGQGYGVRAAGRFMDNFFAHGEYQSTSLDQGGDDAQVMRLGAGFTPAEREDINIAVTGELVQADLIGGSDTGFGVHAGAVLKVMEQLKAFGEVGYLEVGDLSGPEYLVGAIYEFTPQWGAFADYRLTDYGGDRGDLKYGDVQAGVRFDFGAMMR